MRIMSSIAKLQGLASCSARANWHSSLLHSVCGCVCLVVAVHALRPARCKHKHTLLLFEHSFAVLCYVNLLRQQDQLCPEAIG